MIIISFVGVTCCLVGETLMKSSDPASVIKSLLGRHNIDNNNSDNNSNDGIYSGSDDSHGSSSSTSSSTYASMLMSGPLIKTCGMINIDDVKVSLSSGANLIGNNKRRYRILTFIELLSILPFISSIHPFIYIYMYINQSYFHTYLSICFHLSIYLSFHAYGLFIHYLLVSIDFISIL